MVAFENGWADPGDGGTDARPRRQVRGRHRGVARVDERQTGIVSYDRERRGGDLQRQNPTICMQARRGWIGCGGAADLPDDGRSCRRQAPGAHHVMRQPVPQRGLWPQPNQSDVQHSHATAVSGSRCAKRHYPAFSAISASSAISALILPCMERSYVRPPEPTLCCPRRTARAAGSTALTQRSPRAQRSQRRQHDGLSRRAHDRHSSYSPGRIP